MVKPVRVMVLLAATAGLISVQLSGAYGAAKPVRHGGVHRVHPRHEVHVGFARGRSPMDEPYCC
jgi:hypothetical protein